MTFTRAQRLTENIHTYLGHDERSRSEPDSGGGGGDFYAGLAFFVYHCRPAVWCVCRLRCRWFFNKLQKSQEMDVIKGEEGWMYKGRREAKRVALVAGPLNPVKSCAARLSPQAQMYVFDMSANSMRRTGAGCFAPPCHKDTEFALKVASPWRLKVADPWREVWLKCGGHLPVALDIRHDCSVERRSRWPRAIPAWPPGRVLGPAALVMPQIKQMRSVQ